MLQTIESNKKRFISKNVSQFHDTTPGFMTSDVNVGQTHLF